MKSRVSDFAIIFLTETQILVAKKKYMRCEK